MNREPMRDLLRLAEQNAGKIPDQIPAHYVQWAQAQTRKGK